MKLSDLPILALGALAVMAGYAILLIVTLVVLIIGLLTRPGRTLREIRRALKT